jgi:hypothetical protein
MKKNLKEEELKRLIEIAYQLNKDEKGEGFNLEDVKKTAQELGISEDKVNKAYEILELEKQKKIQHSQALQKRTQKVSLIIIGILMIGALYLYFNRPKPEFDGKTTFSITSTLNNGRPTDNLTVVDLFSHKKINFFVDIYQLQNEYKAKWEYYTPDGTLKKANFLNVKKTGYDLSPVYDVLDLTIQDKVGDWTFKFYMDDKKVIEKKFRVELGKPDVSLTDELQEKFPKYPLSIKNEFVKGKEEDIICHIYWPKLAQSGRAEFNWVDPKGNSFKRVSLMNDPKETGEGYYNYSTLNMPDVKTFGKWKVELYFEGIKFSEKEFNILEK